MENYLEAMMILEQPKVADEMDTTGATLDAFYMNYNIDLSPPSTGSNGSGSSDDNKNYQQNSELCVAFCVSFSLFFILIPQSERDSDGLFQRLQSESYDFLFRL